MLPGSCEMQAERPSDSLAYSGRIETVWGGSSYHWSMEILRLHPDEVARFRTLRMRALRDAPDSFGTTLEDANAWSPERWSTLFSGLLAFVAVADAQDVGLVRAAPDLDVQGAARLGSLWVAPRARGKGVGSALVDAVVEWARAEGFDEILLDVADGNRSAIRLYEMLGFVPTGRRTAFPPPREHLGRHQRRLKLQGRAADRLGKVGRPPEP